MSKGVSEEDGRRGGVSGGAPCARRATAEAAMMPCAVELHPVSNGLPHRLSHSILSTSLSERRRERFIIAM